MTDWLLDGVFAWLATRVQDVLGWLLQFMTATIFASPDVTVLPQVTGLAQRSTTVVDAVFALVILAGGVLAMVQGAGEHQYRVQYQVKSVAPRLVTAFGSSVFGLSLCHALTDLANAIMTTLVGQAAAGPRTVAYVQHGLQLASSPAAPFVAPGLRAVMCLIAVLIVVLFLQLLASYVVRVATLLVLAGIAPVALACHALPVTNPVAVMWWRTLLGVLITPVLQGAAFSVGVDLLLNPDHNLSTVLLGGSYPDQAGVQTFNLFLVACLLWVTVRIPRMVARHVSSGGQSSTVGVVVRTVITQTLLRRLPIPGLSRAFR